METLNLDNSPAARRERFVTILAGQFAQPEFAWAAAKHGGPEPYARLFVRDLATGSAMHDGKAVQATCRALGVGKSLKAVRDYLTQETHK